MAVLAAGEGVVKAVHGVEAQGRLLGLADEVYGIEDFRPQAWPGVGEDAFQGEGEVLCRGHDVWVMDMKKPASLRGGRSTGGVLRTA